MLRSLLFLVLAWAGSVNAQVSAANQSPATGVRVEERGIPVPVELRRAADALELDRREIPRIDRVRRLFEFMVGEDGLALRYQEQPTYDIAESYARREVNCLSFTMMFIALARRAGIDAYAQASEDALAMRVVDNTLFRARHVKAGIDIDGAHYTVDVGWRSVVVERNPRRITDVQLLALLHNNNAVEQLAAGDRSKATGEIATAVTLDPDSATIWSNAGVIHWRSGRRSAAEHAYLQALEHDHDHIGALGNLVGMYRATGATRLADQYESRLQRAQESDPFSQFRRPGNSWSWNSTTGRRSIIGVPSGCCPTSRSSIAAWRMPTRSSARTARQSAPAATRCRWSNAGIRSAASPKWNRVLADPEYARLRRSKKDAGACTPASSITADSIRDQNE